jgi:small-conductance mechanosensitive channel
LNAIRRLSAAAALALLAIAPVASAQEAPVAPLPVSEIVARADDVAGDLRALEARLAAPPSVELVESRLPEIASEIDVRLAETSAMLDSRPSLDDVRDAQVTWGELATTLGTWQRDLTARAARLETELAELARLGATWGATLEAARAAGAPDEVLQRAESTVAAVTGARAGVEAQQRAVLALQGRASEQEARVRDAIALVERVREEAVGRLAVRDHPPVWRAWSEWASAAALAGASGAALAAQFDELAEYVRSHATELVLHAVVLVALVAGLVWARRRVRPWVAEQPSLAPAALPFEYPIATAVVVSVLVSGWIYSQMPRVLGALLGAAALVATVLILRRLLERPLLPALYALVLFYFVDLLARVLQTVPAASRTLLLVETLGAIVFLAWLARRPVTQAEGGGASRTERVVQYAALAAFAVFAVALVANTLGYVSLARIVVTAVLTSAYAGLVLFAVVRIADGLVMFALRVRPLALLGTVRAERRLIRFRAVRVVRWAAAFVWVLVTLELLTVREAVVGSITRAFAAELVVGSIHVSLGDAVAFVAVIWLAVMLSRFLRFVLEADVYPRAQFARGIPYAMSTLLHYVVLLVGFIVALGAIGIDMTRFTILAGAFGVGLGFGLQNIVNNFVSGLILLFERPVKVGDTVQLGEHFGDLKRIGLRASVVRTPDGSEVIVPNGQLISAEVINWTFSDQRRRLDVDVGVAYGTEPERVIVLLVDAARAHPDVAAEPAPDALFVRFGESSLDFQLRAWTGRYDRWQRVKSELMLAVNAALRDAGIEIPFPQRDLHVHSLPPEAAQSLEHAGAGERKA